jgi:tRNA threonylcarbamoyladenosine biosynthesis protein TsaB
MSILAFDTSTDTLSIALTRAVDGGQREWQHTGAGGARASSTLIPAILELMAQAGLGFGDLDAIAFGRGPGAFTGLRTACSVAQGLAFGARVPAGRPPLQVLPLDTLAAVAEQARGDHLPGAAPCRVLAMLDARMDEIYAAGYLFDGRCWALVQACRLDRPEYLTVPADWLAPGFVLAGNVFDTYGDRLPAWPQAHRVPALPSASAMLRLAPGMLASGHGVPPEQALPLYIRDKVAQTSAERARARAAAPALASAPDPA